MSISPRSVGSLVGAGVFALAAILWIGRGGTGLAELAAAVPVGEALPSDNLVSELGIADIEGLDRVRFSLAGSGNEARYRVREQLARLSFPSDAVGTTRGVSGALVLDTEGGVVREESRFEVDLTSLSTDNGMRDNYVRRNVLRTEANPTAVFVPATVHGLAELLPGAEEILFHLTGDLTINGVTRSVTWEMRGRTAGNSLLGSARTEFTFGEFDMAIPRVGAILSVQDNIRLEYDFHLERSGE